VDCIKKDKYGVMYVPKSAKKPKDGAKPDTENVFDALRKEIEGMRDEAIKQNRNNLDAMYNIDMDNLSPSLRSLFASWSDGVKNALASVQAVADSQKAVVDIVAQYDDSIASISAKADANGASITQLVQSIGPNGEILSAGIKTAIINDESFIELVADRVTISGTAEFVTRDELSNNAGSTKISGNLINLYMDGSSDDGSGAVTGESSIMFRYDNGEMEEEFAELFTYASGSETATSSRYSLYLVTREMYTQNGWVKPAIKVNAYGGLSLTSRSSEVYVGAETYCLVESGYGTRIRADEIYNVMIDRYAAASNDYVFASDGIYYGGVKLIST
jgi:hypothetical protein